MLIRQSKNSYIRVTDNYGFITNQLTRHDRTYDSYGADLLKQLKREPLEVDDIVSNLLKEYEGVSFDELKDDFMEFAEDLAHDCFVVMGETPEELDAKDKEFQYALKNPISLTDECYNLSDENVGENTHLFFKEEYQGRPMILNMQFELSSRCNERCIHCYIPNDKKNHGFDMPFEKVTGLIDEFSEMGGIHVTLSGGEVFLYKRLREVVEYCRKKDLKISILSNLIALEDNDLEWLKEYNVSLVQTSLYSMDPEIHDRITTVKGSYMKTRNAIEKLIAADIPVQINCPLMQANKDSLRGVREYARQLNIKAQTDYMIIGQADLQKDNLKERLTLDDTEKVLRQIIEDDREYYEDILTQRSHTEEYEINPEWYKKQTVCGVGYDNCCVTANGDVYPCAGWQDYVLGNVYRQTLRDIWENSERANFLRKITQADFPKCLDCEASDYCNRCLVKNYNESDGDMFAVIPHFCDVAFLNKRLVEEKYGPAYERRERILEEKQNSQE